MRRAEFFRKDGQQRGFIKWNRWQMLTRWFNLDSGKKRMLNDLFRHNRRMMKAYLLQESLDRIWTYKKEGVEKRYLNRWIEQLKWQRLKPLEKLSGSFLRHEEGLLDYCQMKVPFDVVEAVNGDIKVLLRQDRGYRNLRYLLLKAQQMAA